MTGADANDGLFAYSGSVVYLIGSATIVLGGIAFGWWVIWRLILSDVGFVRELLGVDKKVKKARTQSAARRRRARAAAAAAEKAD